MGFVGGKVIRIIPDQPGRGGSKSSLSTQSLNLDIRTAHNVFTYYGRWRRAPEAIPASGYQTVPSVTRSIVLHNYASFDTTNAALPPVNKLLSHNLMADATHQITQHNALTVIKNYDPMGGPDTAVPATFLNIKNRCFMCWAATNNFIYDSANAKEYDVGIDAPTTAATYTIGDISIQYVFATAGGNRVTILNPATPPIVTNAVKFVSIAGNTYPTLQPTPLDPGPFAHPGTATGTAGMTALTINGGSFPLRDYDGLTLTVDGNAYFIMSYTLVGPNTDVVLQPALITSPAGSSYTVTGEQVILATPYLGETTTTIVDTGFGLFTSNTIMTAFQGPLFWDSPPQYAYAYYDDPATNTVNGYGTGHISNQSPTTFVTEQNQQGVSVVLDDIIPSGAVDQARFNKIQIFRTILVGGTGSLFPLDPSVGLINNTGVGPLSFTDTFDDSFLLTNPGFVAPQTTNRKPPPFAHQAYWDGRVWGVPVNDPSAVVFSGDISEILYGVAEESYPANNILRVPSDDGRATGMHLVGPLVVITTERYAYYVVGGPISNTYRLRRFSTMMYGVQDYQMAEFAGQTTDDSDALLYLGKDKKVYLTAPSIGNIPMSDPVQDIFTASVTTGYSNTRIADVALNGNHFIICTLEGQITEVYDFDRKVWTDHTPSVVNVGVIRPEAFAKIYGTTQPVQFLFINQGAVYDWLGNNNTTGTLTSYVATSPLMIENKMRRRLQFVRIYVSDNSQPWGIATSINEGGGFQWAAIPEPDPLNSIQPPGSFPLDSPNAVELISVPAVQAQPIIEGYRFQVFINWPNDHVLRDLYAIDVCLTDLEDPATGASI